MFSIARRVLQSFEIKSAGQQYHLTPREKDILQLLIKGYGVKIIAAELKIAFDTARTHLRNIYQKLHVNCGKEAIAKSTPRKNYLTIFLKQNQCIAFRL